MSVVVGLLKSGLRTEVLLLGLFQDLGLPQILNPGALRVLALGPLLLLSVSANYFPLCHLCSSQPIASFSVNGLILSHSSWIFWEPLMSGILDSRGGCVSEGREESVLFALEGGLQLGGKMWAVLFLEFSRENGSRDILLIPGGSTVYHKKLR